MITCQKRLSPTSNASRYGARSVETSNGAVPGRDALQAAARRHACRAVLIHDRRAVRRPGGVGFVAPRRGCEPTRFAAVAQHAPHRGALTLRAGDVRDPGARGIPRRLRLIPCLPGQLRRPRSVPLASARYASRCRHDRWRTRLLRAAPSPGSDPRPCSASGSARRIRRRRSGEPPSCRRGSTRRREPCQNPRQGSDNRLAP